MENVFYGRHVTRIYDLKGSERGRFNPDAAANPGDVGEVHLDDNLRRANLQEPLLGTQRSVRAMQVRRRRAGRGGPAPLGAGLGRAGMLGRTHGSARPLPPPHSLAPRARHLLAAGSHTHTHTHTGSPPPLQKQTSTPPQLALWDDTRFLCTLGVMDYSLLVGVDREHGQLVVAVIDFIRTYTWDKQLETWVKSTGILGGSGKEPTIISPQQYMKRFRRAIQAHLAEVPAQGADEAEPQLDPDAM
jgi:hypothetical protein